MESIPLDNIILALLFASDEPLSARKLAGLLDDVDVAEVGAVVERIGAGLQSDLPSISLERVAGGWQLSTNPEYAEFVARLYSGRRKQRLSKAALETLAIIAYKQPVTRADIENIRGVSCGGVVTTLMERTLIRIVGKAKVLGAPFLYGTTQEFLEYLGLNSLKDLPTIEELEAMLEKEAAIEAERDGETGEPQEDAAAGAETEGSGVATVTTGLGMGTRDDEAEPEGQIETTTNDDQQDQDSTKSIQTEK